MEADMAHLQTDGALVFSRWHNEGITGYRKRPHDPAQLAKAMIDIASGEVRCRKSPKEKTTKRQPPSGKSNHTKARYELL